MQTSGDPSKSIKRFGLTEVYTPSDALVDVIFVHGLDGHPYHTWASEVTKTFWPAQLLPPILKEEKARILVYGYNADVTPVADGVSSEDDKNHSRHCKLSQDYDGPMDEPRDQVQCLGCEKAGASNEHRTFTQLSLKSKDKIHNHAELLLAELWANRRPLKATKRPIIFVAHSLGGLIVKRALVHSSEIRGYKTAHLRSIFVSTYAILFLGTPHQGFDIEKWISRRERARSSTSFPKHIDFRPQIIHSLGIKNETLENIDRQFIQLTNRIRIYFFYEGKPTDILGKLCYVVDEESAAPLFQDVEHTSIQKDHIHMCRFEDERSPGFCVVTEAIQRYAAQAPKKILADWQSEQAEGQVRTEAQVRELSGTAIYHANKAFSTSGVGGDDSSNASGLLDSKSCPASRPKCHYIVPRQRVKHFVGRKAQLHQISSYFATGREKNRPQVLILHALGGQGKSQIAIEYCQSSREEYAGIFWVNANSEDLTLQSYARIAAALNGKSSAEHSERRKAIKIVIDYLEAWDQRWLLVFDNYDSPEAFPNVHDFLPEFGHGHVIFTSRRNQDLDRRGFLLEIPAMDVGDGMSLLLRGHSNQDIKQHSKIASNIVDRLGVGSFFDSLRSQKKEVLSHVPSRFWEYGTMQIHGEEEQNKALSAFTTWEMSLEQLKTDVGPFSNEVTHVLTLSAFFNPIKIEEWVFRHYCEERRSVEECAGWEQLFNASVRKSIDRSHHDSGQGSDNNSHQGSDSNSYERSNDNPCQGSVDASALKSNEKIHDENNDDNYDSSLPDHASVASSFGQECEFRWDSVKFRDTLSRFYDLSLIQSLEWHSDSAIFSLHPLIRDWLQYREQEDSRRSMTIESVAVVVASVKLNKHQPMSLEQRTSLLAHIDACVMSDSQFSEEQHQLGHDLHNCGTAFSLALFYHIQGLEEPAEKLLRRISATQTRLLGMEHVDTLNTMKFYGSILTDRGKYDEAERILGQTVQLQTRILGEEHEYTLRSLADLALTMSRQHKFNEAEFIQRQLLQTCDKILGGRHPNTLGCSSRLAETMCLQGKLVEAEKMLRETLHLSETLLGRQHRDTLAAMYSLFMTLRDQRKYDEAEKLGRELLQLNEELQGKEHPNTLAVMSQFATTLFERGRNEEAVKLSRDVIELANKHLGKNHPSTLFNIHQLAKMLSYDNSSYDEAEQLCSQTLVLRKDVLGNEHTDTLYTMSLLGVILSQHESSYHEAEEIFRETLRLRKKVLGNEHRDTLYSMSLLGEILSRHESSYDETEEIFRETFRLRKKIYGNEHKDTLFSMSLLGEILSRHESSYHEAEEIFRETVRLQKEVLGNEHPDTMWTMRDLVMVLQRQGKCDDTEEINQQMLPRTAEMKTTPDDSSFIESSGESVPLQGQVKIPRKNKRWLSNIRKRFKKGHIDAHQPFPQPGTE